MSGYPSCIVATLKQRPDIAQEALESQFRALIVEPFEETRISTIIAIDALDECKDAAPDSTILSLIAQYIHRILSVKFFITGRPEPSIRNGFRLEPLDAITNIFVLYEIDEASVDSDIKLFLRAHLWAAVKRRSDFNLPSSTPWPSDEDVEILAAQCGQLFIYAATAVSFITSPADQPVERLALLKEIPKKNVGIDQLYTTILATGYSDSEKDDPEYMATWRRVMSGIVIALDPLTRQELAELLQLTPGKVASILRPLHAVLNVPTSADGPITFYHKSFADYISDGARCTDSRFQIVDGFPHIRFPLKSFFANARFKPLVHGPKPQD
ncbi:hypothetical protein Hypma_011256 [Hypsizygus marmoreus]|uniref:Nephrocystin 3-like N-terminal domain-containing protein n=1 Tax=Hypsizygus marmoreus TaxID=39966 RepID=A0A369JIG1_HYPMA|nr:hypothetical protein Hypma_011256 [Hypsizygus marmoreus]